MSKCLKLGLTIPITLLAVAADLLHWLTDLRSDLMRTPNSLSFCTDSNFVFPDISLLS